LKPVWAEYCAAQDIQQASEALAHTNQNLFDPVVLSYPSTVILKASDGERALVFMPVQQCQVWESLGISPQASELETAAALKALTHVLRFKALENGQKEIYFICTEESTQKFAEKHGFERINSPVFRMKL
jgi:hypothetical protein